MTKSGAIRKSSDGELFEVLREGGKRRKELKADRVNRLLMSQPTLQADWLQMAEVCWLPRDALLEAQ